MTGVAGGEVGTGDAVARRMNNKTLPTIDTENLNHVSGGLSLPKLPKLPWWLSNEHLVIPAADPPGHTAQQKKR
jgi:hypothetical protein